MPRLSKEQVAKYEGIKYPSYADGRIIIPPGSKISCKSCNAIENIDTLQARKEFRCKSCKKSRLTYIDIDGREHEQDMLGFVPTYRTKAINKGHTIEDLSDKDLENAYNTRYEFPSDERELIIQEHDRRFVEAKPTETETKESATDIFDKVKAEVKNEEAPEGTTSVQDDMKKRIKSKTDDIKEKDPELYARIIKEYGSTDMFAEIIVDFETDIVYFMAGHKVTKERYGKLKKAWKSILDIYLSTLEAWIKFVPWLMLILAHAGLVMEVMEVRKEKKKQEEKAKKKNVKPEKDKVK